MGRFWNKERPLVDVLMLKMFWERLTWSAPTGRSASVQLEPIGVEPPGRKLREYRSKRGQENRVAKRSRAINRR